MQELNTIFLISGTVLVVIGFWLCYSPDRYWKRRARVKKWPVENKPKNWDRNTTMWGIAYITMGLFHFVIFRLRQ